MRTFLLGSLRHFLANEHTYQQAFKRGGGKQIVSMDDHLIEAEAAMLNAGQDDATNEFDRQWAADLVSRAWDHLHRDMIAEGKQELIDVLRPFVVGGTNDPPEQEQAAARLQMPISTFRNALRRLRLRYREILRAEVARTLSDTAEIDEELHYLFRLLLS